MDNAPQYSFEITVSRTDRNPHLREGAACVIRVELARVDEADDVNFAIDVLRAPLSERPEEETILTSGRPFVRALLGSFLTHGMECRIEAAGADLHSWKWPVVCRTLQDVDPAIGQLCTQVGLPRDMRPYPLSIWALPSDPATRDEVVGRIQRFRDDPSSLSLWRSIINAGVTRVTVTETTCSIACDCDQIDCMTRHVKRATSQSGIPSEWFGDSRP